MPKQLLVCAGVLGTLSSVACDTEPRETTLRVDHYREPCDDTANFCLRISSEGQDAAQVLSIDGFAHEWGTAYDISARVYDGAEGPEYELIEVIQREHIAQDARFELTIRPEFVQRIDTYGVSLVADTHASCATETVCFTIRDALANGEPVTLELSHDERGGGQLIGHSARRVAEQNPPE